MQTPKALITYRDQPQAGLIFDLLKSCCQQVFLSTQPGQWQGSPLEHLPSIPDQNICPGPLNGILTAMSTHPQVNWLVTACDLPHLSLETLLNLVCSHHPEAAITCYLNPDLRIPEPLCTLYTPAARPLLQSGIQSGVVSPVRILQSLDQPSLNLLNPVDLVELTNVNTPDEAEQAKQRIQVKIQLSPWGTGSASQTGIDAATPSDDKPGSPPALDGQDV